jgi:EAL domain-containing protein (putative c-di-GMP-specific phosphodiesterase class I)
VRTCATLADFEDTLETFEPDLVLIDLMMPELDGIDVVRRIGPRTEASLYVMSGTDMRTFDASREVLASGGTKVAGFLHKPFGAQELSRVLTSSSMPQSSKVTHLAARASEKVLSPAEFEKAVLSGRIEPHFQPIFYSDGRTLKGFEALARVEGGRSSCFAPGYLEQLAADHELAATLTDIVIQRALRFVADLPDRGGDLSISINLFGDYAVANGLREWLVEQCERNRIAKHRVVLELSEATVFNLDDDELRRITQLRLAGFGLSIDDFGTGYSSLGRLASLPFSELKIDKAFCLALLHSRPAAAVIEACLGLAARLDMKVIAEGVEDEEVAAVLASMGCDALQGHLFGKAMSADEVAHWLRACPPRAAA